VLKYVFGIPFQPLPACCTSLAGRKGFFLILKQGFSFFHKLFWPDKIKRKVGKYKKYGNYLIFSLFRFDAIPLENLPLRR
jgi:hypothetical protein